MELEDIKEMWQAHEAKIEKTTALNLHTLEMIQSHKVRSVIKPLLVKNMIVLVLHALTIIALLVFLIFNFSQLPYAVSAIVLIGYYVLLYINQYRQVKELWLIRETSDVVTMQTALTKLKTHILHFMKFSVLTIPAFLSFPVVVPKAFADLNMNVLRGFDMVKQTNGEWWHIEIITFAVLIPLGIWFYTQVTPKNMHKKWVRKIIMYNKGANKTVNKAVQYLNELEEIKAGADL